MTDDEKFDAWLVEAAADYNRPPVDAPREAMWQAIRPAVAAGAVASITARRPSLVPRWVPLAAAAALLVVVSYEVGQRRGAASTAQPGTSAAVPASPDSAIYATATGEHFGRADALLTSVRAVSSGDPLDASLQAWARELLVDTRLLIDSPAAADPARRRLLEDLELALAQIVQLSAAATPDDHRLVERSLQRGELLTRIRTVVPWPISGT